VHSIDEEQNSIIHLLSSALHDQSNGATKYEPLLSHTLT